MHDQVINQASAPEPHKEKRAYDPKQRSEGTRQRLRYIKEPQRRALVALGQPGSAEVVYDPIDLVGWRIEARLVSDRGHPVVVELLVSPLDPHNVPSAGITARMMRSLRFEPLLTALRRESPAAQAVVLPQLTADDRRRPGRSGRDDRFYAEWAARYVAKCRTGTKRPHVELATEHGLVEATVRGWVQEARRRGLIVSIRRGLPGGELTEKAMTLLSSPTPEPKREVPVQRGAPTNEETQ